MVSMKKTMVVVSAVFSLAAFGCSSSTNTVEQPGTVDSSQTCSPDVAAMCEWCHAVRGNGGVKLLSVSTDDRHRVGLYLCSDLGCVARSRQTPGPDDVPDRLDGSERARRTVRRISEFASRRLF